MRPPGRRASAARFSEVGGHCQRAASKDQRNRARVPPLYPLTRAHEGRAAMSAVGQRSDPLGPPRRRCGCWPTSQLRFSCSAFSSRPIRQGDRHVPSVALCLPEFGRPPIVHFLFPVENRISVREWTSSKSRSNSSMRSRGASRSYATWRRRRSRSVWSGSRAILGSMPRPVSICCGRWHMSGS